MATDTNGTGTAMQLFNAGTSGKQLNLNPIQGETEPTGPQLTLVRLGSSVKIKQAGSDLYLTADESGGLTWAAPDNSKTQQWTFTDTTGSDTPTGGTDLAGDSDTLGKNYATYPCTHMNITQTPYDGNHAGYSGGSPADYPIDDGCEDTGRSWMYCPVDEMEVVGVYGVGNKGVNTIWLTSTSEVVMPCGTAKLTMMVMHPEDEDLQGLAGRRFQRGEKMFREGGDGGFANHFHISCGKGISQRWTENSKGCWVLSTTGGTIKPEEAFFIDPSFTTIRSKKGIAFQNVP